MAEVGGLLYVSAPVSRPNTTCQPKGGPQGHYHMARDYLLLKRHLIHSDQLATLVDDVAHGCWRTYQDGTLLVLHGGDE